MHGGGPGRRASASDPTAQRPAKDLAEQAGAPLQPEASCITGSPTHAGTTGEEGKGAKGSKRLALPAGQGSAGSGISINTLRAVQRYSGSLTQKACRENTLETVGTLKSPKTIS